MTQIAERKIFGRVFHYDIPKYLLMRTKHICDLQNRARSQSSAALTPGAQSYVVTVGGGSRGTRYSLILQRRKPPQFTYWTEI